MLPLLNKRIFLNTRKEAKEPKTKAHEKWLFLCHLFSTLIEKDIAMAKGKTIQIDDNVTHKFFDDIAGLVNEARNRVAVIVNREITILNWNIGKAINNYLLNSRAEYGEQIVATLSHELTNRFGKGFTKSALNRMINFYLAYSNEKIVATL